MPDRSISITGGAATSADNSQSVARKGPRRATVSSARFLERDQRRAIYRMFQEGWSIEQISSCTGLRRLGVQDIIREGNDQRIGEARAQLLVMQRRAA